MRSFKKEEWEWDKEKFCLYNVLGVDKVVIFVESWNVVFLGWEEFYLCWLLDGEGCLWFRSEVCL